MRILLDTHAFLWFTAGNNKLSSAAKNLIEDPANEKLLNSVVGGEIAIKFSLGKLELSAPVFTLLDNAIKESDWTLVNYDLSDISKVATLPFHHRDPFDRMLVAQSLVGAWPIVSCDEKFDTYGIERLW